MRRRMSRGVSAGIAPPDQPSAVSYQPSAFCSVFSRAAMTNTAASKQKLTADG